MRITRATYREIERDGDYRTIARSQGIPREDPDRQRVQDAVGRFLDGKLNGHVEIRRVRHTDLKRLELTEIVKVSKVGRRKQYTRELVALDERHIEVAHLQTRQRRTLAEMDDDGDPIPAFVGLTIVNSDQVDIPFGDPKGEKTKKTTKKKATRKRRSRKKASSRS